MHVLPKLMLSIAVVLRRIYSNEMKWNEIKQMRLKDIKPKKQEIILNVLNLWALTQYMVQCHLESIVHVF